MSKFASELYNSLLLQDCNALEDILKQGSPQETLTDPGILVAALAMYTEHSQVLDILIKYSSHSAKIQFLEHCLEKKKLSLIERLLDHGLDPNTCLDSFGPILVIDVTLVEKLLEYGLDPNTSLSLDRFQSLLSAAVSVDNFELVELLLRHHADLNAWDHGDKRINPLFIAVERGNLAMCKLLTSKGADVDIRNIHRKTPLHKVAMAKDNRVEIARVLMEAGCCINAVNDKGETPLTLSYRNVAGDDLAKLLIQNGSNHDHDHVSFYSQFWRGALFPYCSMKRMRDLRRISSNTGDSLRLKELKWVQMFLNPSTTMFLDSEGLEREYSSRIPEVKKEYLENRMKLTFLCRIPIRHHLVEVANGRAICLRVKDLPLPEALKSFIMLES